MDEGEANAMVPYKKGETETEVDGDDDGKLGTPSTSPKRKRRGLPLVQQNQGQHLDHEAQNGDGTQAQAHWARCCSSGPNSSASISVCLTDQDRGDFEPCTTSLLQVYSLLQSHSQYLFCICSKFMVEYEKNF